MRCAIVIVTYNSRRFLRELFDSLAAHTALAELKILIVENASTDGTPEVLQQLAQELPQLPIEILTQSENRGFAGGCNVGIARARQLGARFVQLLNPDTVVAAGWIEPVLQVLETRPAVAAAQPLILLYDEPNLVNSAGNEIHFCGFGYCGGYRQTRAAAVATGAVRSVSYASGAALLLRMSALDEVEDFDETLFLYHEECDLQIRLRLAGYDCVLVPEAHIFHKYSDDFSPRKYGWLERNRQLVLLKNWPRRELLCAAPALIGVEAAVLLFALRRGVLREKLWADREFFRHFREMLRKRKKVQARRRVGSLSPHLTGAMGMPGIKPPLSTRLGNPVLSAYWALCRATVLRQRRGDAMNTTSEEYARRLETLSGARWKRLFNVQAPYRYNLRRLQPGYTLDVGCGIGRNLLHLDGNGVGIDHNEQSVALARARGLQAFTPADFEASPHNRPHRFDSLLFAHVAEHMRFDEAVALLRRYLPLLKPGGKLIVITPQEAGYRSDPTHVEFFDFARLGELFSAVGLREQTQYSFPLPRSFGRLFPHNEFVMVGAATA